MEIEQRQAVEEAYEERQRAFRHMEETIEEYGQLARVATSQKLEQGYRLFGQSSPEIFHQFEQTIQQLTMEFEQRLHQRQNDLEEQRIKARQDLNRQLEG